MYEANAASMNGEPCSVWKQKYCEGAEIILVTPMGGG